VKILVISSNLIGDTILSTGIVDHFLKNNPNSRFTFIIGPTAGQIYQNFPNLEKIILIKKEKFNTHWLKIYLHSWNIKWDIIVDLRSSFLSYLLFHKKKYIFKKDKNKHHLDQLISFFRSNDSDLNIYINGEEEDIVKNKLNPGNIYVVIFPGGNWKPKIWPSNNYNQLIKKLVKNFSNMKFLIVGSADEEDLYLNPIKKNIPEDKIINLMGISLTLTSAYMKKSHLFIGNDSGLMHLSVASHLNTIGLFGPTNDNIYGHRRKNCFVIRTKEDYSYFNRLTLDKNKSYMTSIHPDQVVDIIANNNLL
jgi:ADP-heptose:LPS heptosyltransferase